MWLQVPDDVREVLWEGPLQPEAPSIDRLRRSWPGRKPQGDLEDLARNLPVVSIGQPETWPLASLYELDRMPPLLRTKANEADFYLIRLACSFRPVRREARIEWARFVIALHSDREGRQPLAEDLYPNEINHEVQHRTKVTLSPSLKFQLVEASLGSAEFGFEYPELQPVITAAGHSSAEASWDYSEVPGAAMHGGKWMHLLVKAPKGMPSAEANIYLVADVAAARGVVRAFVKNKPTDTRDQLPVRLWG